MDNSTLEKNYAKLEQLVDFSLEEIYIEHPGSGKLVAMKKYNLN